MDLVRDWLDAVKLFSAPMGDVAQGSEISFRGFLQDGIVQNLIRHKIFQPRVLFLKGFSLLAVRLSVGRYR